MKNSEPAGAKLKRILSEKRRKELETSAYAEMKFDLTHAKHDRAHCLAPGLFRSLRAGERKLKKLDVHYIFGDATFRFVGHEPLDATDMRVLQGLVALTGANGIELTLPATTATGKALRAAMFDPATMALPPDQIDLFPELAKNPSGLSELRAVKTLALSALAREIGYAECDGRTAARIRASIQRLFGVTLFVTRKGLVEGYRLLSKYVENTATDKLSIALNPRLSAAILNAPYAHIDMSEVRALMRLDSEVAALIHQRLCAFVSRGKDATLLLDTVMGYAYHDPDGLEPERTALAHRRAKVRTAMEIIDMLPNWTVTPAGSNRYLVSRGE